MEPNASYNGPLENEEEKETTYKASEYEGNIPLELVQIKCEPKDFFGENNDEFEEETCMEHLDINLHSEAQNKEMCVKIKSETHRVNDSHTLNEYSCKVNVRELLKTAVGKENGNESEMNPIDNCFVGNCTDKEKIYSVKNKKRNIDMIITSSKEKVRKKKKVIGIKSCMNVTENLGTYGKPIYIKQEVDPSSFQFKDDDEEYVLGDIGDIESNNFNPHNRIPQQGTFIYCAASSSEEYLSLAPEIPETYANFMSNIPTRYSHVIYHKLLRENKDITLDAPVDRPFKCECGKTFKRKSHLQRHTQIHSGIRYSCDECGQCFSEKGTLVGHMLLHNGITHKCQFCAKCFKRKGSLYRHVLIHKGVKFRCQFCGKLFSDRGTLDAHSWIHKGVVHQCGLCQKYFGYKSALAKHMLHHNGVIYKCSECHKTFNHKSSLSSHMLTHDGVDYRCEVCGKSFSWKCALTRHLLLHEKGALYKCEKCDQCYRRKDTFIMHMLLHEGIGYKCKQCGKYFSQKTVLGKHMRRMHKNR